jgi:hypothetical protein
MYTYSKENKMKTFVVAYISFFENRIEQRIVKADTAISAQLYFLASKGWDINECGRVETEETLNELCSNCDVDITAIEI